MGNKILLIFAIERPIKELCPGIFVIWSSYVECPLALAWFCNVMHSQGVNTVPMWSPDIILP